MTKAERGLKCATYINQITKNVDEYEFLAVICAAMQMRSEATGESFLRYSKMIERAVTKNLKNSKKIY